MIEVILLERIERLGQMGQVVKVRPGFARNFLLPEKKALRATKANLEVFEKDRAAHEARNAAMRTEAQGRASRIDNAMVTVIRQASEMGQLFGSVSSRDIADAAKDAGHTIDRNQVFVDAPIKTLGLFPVKVKLHPEVTVKITLNVARSPEEAVVQAQKGVAAVAAEKAADEVFVIPGTEEQPLVDVPVAVKPARKTKKAGTESAPDDGDQPTVNEEPKTKKPRAKKTTEA
jgi:large subunit ribosomal protein L9